MNPFILFLLQSILPIIESAVASEGPVVIAWLEAELARLVANKPVTPSPLPVAPKETPTEVAPKTWWQEHHKD